PTVRGWGFFLPDLAGSRVLAGVPAEACGLRQPPELAVPGHIPLSPGHSSLRRRPRNSPEVRKDREDDACKSTRYARTNPVVGFEALPDPRKPHGSRDAEARR